MRIDYLSSSYMISDTANSVHVSSMSSAFSKSGHNVCLHAYKGSGSEKDVREYYGLDQKVDLNLEDFGQRPLFKVLRTLKKVLPIGAFIRLLEGYRGLSAKIENRNPDLLFARNVEWLLSCRATAHALVFESHSPPNSAFQRWLQAKLFRQPNFQALVVISQALRDIYLERFPALDPQRVIVAHDGADEAPGTTSSQSDRIEVGYVGHLYAGRGGALMLELARRFPEADFHLVGGRAQDIDRLRRSEPPANVFFHGHQPPSVLSAYFPRFDIVLAPYQNKVSVAGNAGNTVDYMSPLKIFEYMSWGRAIIASRLPVIEEVLEDGKTALLAPPDDADAWSDAVRSLIGDETLRVQLGQTAKEEFLSRYSWSSRVECILQQLDL